VFRNVTKAEAWERFSASFDTDKDGKVKEASYKDCYTQINIWFNNDDEYVSLLNRSWGMY